MGFDNKYALREGWCVAFSENGVPRIAASEDSNYFEFDSSARAWVESLAADGSQYHQAALDFCTLVVSASVTNGIATLANGRTVDLLMIQCLLNDAFAELGDASYAKAANELSFLTLRVQGPHGDFTFGTAEDL